MKPSAARVKCCERQELIVWLQFIACTALILFSGSKLSFYGDIIAEKTGMGRTWIGVVLLASVTSLPELITGVSSVTIFDLPNIAAGDVLGSCMFNMLIIAMLDFIGGSTPLSARAHQGQVLGAGFGILLLGLVGISLFASASHNFNLCLLRFDRRLVLNLTENVERFTVIDLVADTSIIPALDLTVRAANDFDFACHWAPLAASARSSGFRRTDSSSLRLLTTTICGCNPTVPTQSDCLPT